MKQIRPPVVGPTAEYLEIGDTVLAVLKIETTSLELRTERDERVAHRFYQRLLNAIEHPVYVHSRQYTTNLDGYIDQFEPIPGLEKRQKDYHEYCQQLYADGFGVAEHFLILRAGQSGEKSGVDTLQTRLNTVLETFAATDIEVEPLTGDSLYHFVDRELNQDPDVSPAFSTVPGETSNEYRKTLFIEEFPTEVKFAWPADLFQLDGLVDVTQVIRPQNIDTASDKLSRLVEWLEIEILSFLARGIHGFETLERLADDAKWFQERLADYESRAHEYGIYITAHGPTKEEVEDTYDRIRTQLRLLGIQSGSTMFRTDQAYYTDSPFHRDYLDQVSLMPSESVAAGFPFATRPMKRAGVVYGIDKTEDTPVLLDRFSWNSHSMAIMGTLGSGKSYWTQLELLRAACVYPNLRIIVIDPKIEYSDVIEVLGGYTQIIQRGLVYDFQERFTSFRPEERGILDHEDSLVELLEQVYTSVSKNQARTIVVVDEAKRLLDHSRGRGLLNQFVLEARDINTALQIISQSASHFTNRREGKDILDNVPATAFFRHKRVSQSMKDYFDLSDPECGKILGLPTGKDAGYSEALLHIPGQERIQLRVESTAEEHRIIDRDGAEETGESEPSEHVEKMFEDRTTSRFLDSIGNRREYLRRTRSQDSGAE